MMESEIENKTITYTAELKNELDKRYAAYENGADKGITAAESKKYINKILKNAGKK